MKSAVETLENGDYFIKQIYKMTYPTGVGYIGKESVGGYVVSTAMGSSY